MALRLSPYDKKLTNFIVNPDGQLEKEGKKITADHLITVFKRQLTRLNWNHFKLTPNQGPKRGSKGLSPIALLMGHQTSLTTRYLISYQIMPFLIQAPNFVGPFTFPGWSFLDIVRSLIF